MKGAPFLPNLIQALYKTAVQPFLFGFNAETAHNWAVKRMKQLDRVPLALNLLSQSLSVNDPRLHVTVKTLSCPNPVGLAAGFDKAGELIRPLSNMGFGFIELGTFTPLPQEGQEKPRLFRYKKEKAIVNRMGFNNPGVKVVAEKLKSYEVTPNAIPIGLNIGKGRNTPLDEAVDDYLMAMNQLHSFANYIVFNVSSPNTPNLRDLQATESLRILTKALADQNKKLSEQKGIPPKPLFVKVSPDVHEEMLEDIASIALESNVGLIATNTTIDHASLKSRRQERGGLSGKPLKSQSNLVLKRLYQLTRGVVPIIGVGGIFSAEDAYEKICLGASLIQVYTGWIYEGPGLVPKINKGILKMMERDGFKKIQDAVGSKS